MRKIDISVIILTKNEEKNLRDCLESLREFAKRVIVVDSGSKDKTIEIAKEYGADIYYNPFINYAKQFNWAIDNTNIETEWTMRLDADERMTPNLHIEIIDMINDINQTNSDINGITLEADLYFLKRKISHGGPQKRKLMIFRTGIGRIEDKEMDEHTYLIKGSSIAATEKFIHYDFKDLTHFVDKMNKYASREVEDYFSYKNNKMEVNKNLKDKNINKTQNAKFKFYYKLPKFLRALMLFLYIYIIKLGFLDGTEGFIYHFLYSFWYRLLVDAKIFEKEIQTEREVN